MSRMFHPQPIKCGVVTAELVVFQVGDDAIWGTGATEEKARADAGRWLG